VVLAIEGAVLNFPAWSPDGSRIAFSMTAAGSDDPWTIHVLHRDGTLVRLSPSNVYDVAPSWSPDGGRIAFQSRSFPNGNDEISRRIAEDPAIIDRVIEWINQHEREEPDPSKRELEEWRSVLTTLSSRQVEALLMEESERADRLRQSLPFVDVLTSEDRAAMFRERRDAQRARARHPRRV
jgi:dipeptidyl aminopeptidase/acylaminoacyl peptidase